MTAADEEDAFSDDEVGISANDEAGVADDEAAFSGTVSSNSSDRRGLTWEKE